MTEINDYFDDGPEPDDEAAELDTEALARAAAESEKVNDDPDIDTPSLPGGSQRLDRAGAAMPEMPSAGDVLRGAAPVFLVHKSHHFTPRVPEVLGVARRVTGGRIGLGAIARLPRLTPTAAMAFLDSCRNTSLKIADPEVFAVGGQGSPAEPVAAKQHQYYPWLTEIPAVTDPQVDRAAWVELVLEAQVAAGANVLLSASGWVPATQGRAQLQAAMSWVNLSRQVAGADSPMFVNLTLSGEWLKNPTLRATFLQEIVESNEPLWYLRVRWPIVDPRYGQLTDTALLDGYRELSAIAALEGKILVLPNSGLTGWMATALGAAGFSTGMSWPEHAFADQPRFGSQPGQPRPAPAERYFERSVLHPILWSDAQNLASVAGYRSCQCRYCVSMRADGYDKERANAHYLVRVARLLDELGTTNRRLEALRIVRDAQTFLSGLAGTTNALPAKWTPSHLPLWRARLL